MWYIYKGCDDEYSLWFHNLRGNFTIGKKYYFYEYAPVPGSFLVNGDVRLHGGARIKDAIKYFELVSDRRLRIIEEIS